MSKRALFLIAIATASLGAARPAMAASCDFVASSGTTDFTLTSSDGTTTHSGLIMVSDWSFQGTSYDLRSEWQLDDSLDGSGLLNLSLFHDDFIWSLDFSDSEGQNPVRLEIQGACNGTRSVTGTYSLSSGEAGTITLTLRP